MMVTSVRRAVTACLMVLIPLAAPGYSQETTGTILGTLTDQTGTLLVGAIEVLTVEAERLVQPTSAVQTLIQSAAVHELR